MALQNNLREITRILYNLKRRYGQTVIFKTPIVNTYDLDTGDVNRQYTSYTIKRVIVAPMKTVRDFVYDLSYIAANKNFTYGGFFDASLRGLIVDKKELEKVNATYIPTIKDTVEIENRPHTIKEIVMAEHNRGFILVVKEISVSEDI